MLVCLCALSAGIFPCLCLRTFCVNSCSRSIICSHHFHEQGRSSIQKYRCSASSWYHAKTPSVIFGLVASILRNPGSSSEKFKIEISPVPTPQACFQLSTISSFRPDLDPRDINPIAKWSKHLPLLLQQLALLRLVSWVRKALWFLRISGGLLTHYGCSICSVL